MPNETEEAKQAKAREHQKQVERAKQRRVKAKQEREKKDDRN